MPGGSSPQRLSLNHPLPLPKGTSELRVDLADFEGKHVFAKYSSFQIQGEAEKYKLILGNFLGGDAGEQLGVSGVDCEVRASELLWEEKGLLFIFPWWPCVMSLGMTSAKYYYLHL